MKKLLLSLALLSSFAMHAGPYTMYKNVSDWIGCQFHGYIEISPIYYPKTITLLNELKVKYPVELNDVEMSIGSSSTFYHKNMGLSLSSSLNTIYFPVEWIDAIEKGDESFIQLTEWAMLREAGIMCNFTRKIVIDSIEVSGSVILGTSLAVGFASDSPTTTIIGSSVGGAIVSVASLAYVYEYFFAQARADNYATSHCQNPKAIIAAYEHIDRFSARGLVYSFFTRFADLRLSNMKKAFVKKFGYELEVAKRQA
jgi:hypothetical protein